MRKSELIAKTAKDRSVTKQEAKEALEAIISAITEELDNGGDVILDGFGKFHVIQRKGRTGKNLQGETYTTQDRAVPKFTPSNVLKQRIQG